MPLATLTWNNSGESAIGGTRDLTGFLLAVKRVIDASTHWNCSAVQDFTTQAQVIISPKSTDPAVSPARIVLWMNNEGSIVNATDVGPVAAAVIPGHSTTFGTYVSHKARLWVSVSSDSGQTISANCKTTNPFVGKSATGFVALRTGDLRSNSVTGTAIFVPYPDPVQPIWLIESAEGFSLNWANTADDISGFTAGRLWLPATKTDNVAYWCLLAHGAYHSSTNGSGNNPARAGGGWFKEPVDWRSGPIGVAKSQNSGRIGDYTDGGASNTPAFGSYGRGKQGQSPCDDMSAGAVGVGIGPSGILYGLGRDYDCMFYGGGGYGTSTMQVLQEITLCGGPWTAGDRDEIQGFLRQIRRGARGKRHQLSKRVDNSVAAIHLTYHSTADTMGGLWFHNDV